LPLFQYLTITAHPLASHPNDPKKLSETRSAGHE
jgi:muconolactone delta-isomerase